MSPLSLKPRLCGVIPASEGVAFRGQQKQNNAELDSVCLFPRIYTVGGISVAPSEKQARVPTLIPLLLLGWSCHPVLFSVFLYRCYERPSFICSSGRRRSCLKTGRAPRCRYSLQSTCPGKARLLFRETPVHLCLLVVVGKDVIPHCWLETQAD